MTMDPGLELTLDIEDLCLQMNRSSLLCADTNRDDLLKAIHATRYYLRIPYKDRPISDVQFHLQSRSNAYNVYSNVIKRSHNLQFLFSAIEEFQYQWTAACTERSFDVDMDFDTKLLRLAYFIDREICVCCGIEETC